MQVVSLHAHLIQQLDGLGGTQSGLSDLFNLFKYPEWCATGLISKTFWGCDATLFNWIVATSARVLTELREALPSEEQ